MRTGSRRFAPGAKPLLLTTGTFVSAADDDLAPIIETGPAPKAVKATLRAKLRVGLLRLTPLIAASDKSTANDDDLRYQSSFVSRAFANVP